MAKRVVLLDKEFKDPSRLVLFPVHSVLGTGGRVAGCRFSRRGGSSFCSGHISPFNLYSVARVKELGGFFCELLQLTLKFS